MSYTEVRDQAHRLLLLQRIAESPGYRANDDLLSCELAVLAFEISRDQIRTNLSWLAEQGLVRLETVSSILVAELTQRGLDVATGRARAPGVARPGPRP